jgi:hypothetical protein
VWPQQQRQHYGINMSSAALVNDASGAELLLLLLFRRDGSILPFRPDARRVNVFVEWLRDPGLDRQTGCDQRLLIEPGRDIVAFFGGVDVALVRGKREPEEDSGRFC